MFPRDIAYIKCSGDQFLENSYGRGTEQALNLCFEVQSDHSSTFCTHYHPTRLTIQISLCKSYSNSRASLEATHDSVCVEDSN